MNTTHEWLTANEAADYCRLNYHYFLKLVKSGIIYHPPRQKKGKYRFKVEWLDNYLMGKHILPPSSKPPKPKYRILPCRAIGGMIPEKPLKSILCDCRASLRASWDGLPFPTPHHAVKPHRVEILYAYQAS